MNSTEIILKNYKNGNLTLDESIQLLRDINKYPYYPYYPYYSTSESGKNIPVEFTTTYYTYD